MAEKGFFGEAWKKKDFDKIACLLRHHKEVGTRCLDEIMQNMLVYKDILADGEDIEDKDIEEIFDNPNLTGISFVNKLKKDIVRRLERELKAHLKFKKSKIKRASFYDFRDNLVSQVENVVYAYEKNIKKTEEEIDRQRAQKIIEYSLARVPADVRKHYQDKLGRVTNAKSEGGLDRFFKTLEGILKEAIITEAEHILPPKQKIESKGKKANAEKKFKPRRYLEKGALCKKYKISKSDLNEIKRGNFDFFRFADDVRYDAGREFYNFAKEQIESIKIENIDDLLDNYSSQQVAEDIVDEKIEETGETLVDKGMKGCFIKEFAKELQKKGFIRKIGNKYHANEKKIRSIIEKKEQLGKLELLKFSKETKLNAKALGWGEYFYYPDLKEREGEKTLNPYRIGREFLGDLIATAEGRGDTKRQKELLEVAKKIINGKVVSVRDVKTVLSKPGKILFSQVKASLEQKNLAGELQDTQQFRVFDYDEIRKNGLDLSLLSKEFGDSLKQSGLYFACRDIIVSELIRSLEEAEGRNGGSSKILSTFWKRYSPLEYDLMAAKKSKKITELFDEYKFEVTKDVGTLRAAAKRAHSCLTENNLIYFEKDIGTRFLVGHCKNKPVGYLRIFIGETPANEPVFAIDTIEVDAREGTGKDFVNNLDWMRAMGLASVQFALDANAKYVFCSDSRVEYGLRQAFGNKYLENAKFKKLGEPNPRNNGGYTYAFHFVTTPGEWKGKTSVLLVNWRNR